MFPFKRAKKPNPQVIAARRRLEILRGFPEEIPREYYVLSFLLKSEYERTKKTLAILSEPKQPIGMGFGYDPLSSDSVKDEERKGIRRAKSRVLKRETRENYSAKLSTEFEIQPWFHLKFPYVLVKKEDFLFHVEGEIPNSSWLRLKRIAPGAKSYLRLTRVGFDKSYQQALAGAEVHHLRGITLCYWFLIKKRTSWHVIESFEGGGINYVKPLLTEDFRKEWEQE